MAVAVTTDNNKAILQLKMYAIVSFLLKTSLNIYIVIATCSNETRIAVQLNPNVFSNVG